MDNPQDRASIFGDTYNGVPSPTIAHVHPYPTRFHGPIYTTPRFGMPYQPQSWQVAGPGPQMAGFGDTPALFGSASGNTFVDTLVGAVLGYAMAPKQDDKLLWAGAGGAAGLLAGTLGLVGVIGAAIYVRSK